MLDRSVVRHEVEDEANAALVQRVHQPVEVRKRAKKGIDVDIVGDVIPEVGHRRGIDRRDPDGVDAEPLQVVDALEHALQVADAIAIAVLKRARINLIDDRLPPPGLLAHQLLQLPKSIVSSDYPSRGRAGQDPCNPAMDSVRL
jgi:hypothetical protein